MIKRIRDCYNNVDCQGKIIIPPIFILSILSIGNIVYLWCIELGLIDG